MKRKRQDPILVAIDHSSYDWMTEQAPRYLTAITEALEKGDSPEDIYATVSYNVGPDRQALARRCMQVARHLLREQG